jgi:hypothetical protein
MSSFPLRPEDTKEGFFEAFLRTSGVAWAVYIIYRIFESNWFGTIMVLGNIRNSIPIKASLLFFITVLATYFTNSSKTRVYRQSIT